MSKQWRCAVVGVGVIGDWHVQVIPAAGATLAAVCDVVPEKAKAVLEKNKISVPVYDDLAEMLRKEKIDVVHVCTPSGSHMEPAITAMEAGKNIICEKPLEIHVDRIDRMIEAANKNKVRLAGIFQNRWNLANKALKDAAAENRYGRIAWAGSFTPWYRTDQYYRDGGWRGTWKFDGGGAIMNQSVHAVDLLQWIVGPVKTVSAYASSRIHAEIEVEDTLSCSLQFENGAYGTIMGTTAMWPGQSVRVEVGGEFGMAVSEAGLKMFKFKDERPEDKQLLEKYGVGPTDALKTKLRNIGGDELLNKLGLAKATTGGGSSATDLPFDLHRQNVRHILDSWEAGKDADTCGPEARKAVAIIEAMYESAKKNGAPVAVK